MAMTVFQGATGNSGKRTHLSFERRRTGDGAWQATPFCGSDLVLVDARLLVPGETAELPYCRRCLNRVFMTAARDVPGLLEAFLFWFTGHRVYLNPVSADTWKGLYRTGAPLSVVYAADAG